MFHLVGSHHHFGPFKQRRLRLLLPVDSACHSHQRYHVHWWSLTVWKPAACPLPAGTLGVGVSGQKMRIATLDIGARPGHLLVSRELPPAIRYHPSGTPAQWSLDEVQLGNIVPGRENNPRHGGFEDFGGMVDMSYAGKILGDPDIGAEPCVEGSGAMRVEGEKAGFELPSHPRLWEPSFTIAFWFRADDIDDATQRRHLFDDGGRRTGMSLYLLGGTLRAAAWDDSAKDAEEKWETWLADPSCRPGRRQTETGRWWAVRGEGRAIPRATSA